MATEREDELLRLNAELAAEIRRLGSREAGDPRSDQAPAARRLSRLIAERDELLAERGKTQAQLDEQVRRNELLEENLEQAIRERAELESELHRRSGVRGLLRRIGARVPRWR
jgi:mannitol-1-phosphate/altronate dehydrogenase